MNNKNFAFGKINFVLMAVSVAIVLVGFVLMSGGQSTEEAYDPSIFSTMRIKVAPAICFFGYIFMIFAIVYRPKKTSGNDSETVGDKAKKNVGKQK